MRRESSVTMRTVGARRGGQACAPFSNQCGRDGRHLGEACVWEQGLWRSGRRHWSDIGVESRRSGSWLRSVCVRKATCDKRVRREARRAPERQEDLPVFTLRDDRPTEWHSSGREFDSLRLHSRSLVRNPIRVSAFSSGVSVARRHLTDAARPERSRTCC